MNSLALPRLLLMGKQYKNNTKDFFFWKKEGKKNPFHPSALLFLNIPVSVHMRVDWNSYSPGTLTWLLDYELPGRKQRPLSFTWKPAECQPVVADPGCVRAKSLQSCPTLCESMGYNPPGFSVRGILQARILQRVVMPSSRESPNPGMNPGLLHCRQILYQLSHQGCPLSHYWMLTLITW